MTLSSTNFFSSNQKTPIIELFDSFEGVPFHSMLLLHLFLLHPLALILHVPSLHLQISYTCHLQSPLWFLMSFIISNFFPTPHIPQMSWKVWTTTLQKFRKWNIFHQALTRTISLNSFMFLMKMEIWDK